MTNFDGEKFRKELLEIYPNMYLTWLSMIQGVVFATLLYKGFSSIIDFKICLLEKIGIVIYILLSVGILALIWFDYLYNNIFKRIPNLRDAFFPILFGIFQVGLAFFLNNPRIWMGFSLLIGVTACFAYPNTRIQVMKEMKFEEEIKFEEEDCIHKCSYDFQLKLCFQKIQIEKVRIIWIMMITIAIFLLLRFIRFESGFFFIYLILDILLSLILAYLLLISFRVTLRLYQNCHEIVPKGNIKRVWMKIWFDFFHLEKKWLQRWAERELIKILPEIEKDKLKEIFEQWK
jgi:hypothetical protein